MRSLILILACLISQSGTERGRFQWLQDASRLYSQKQYAASASAYREAIKSGDRTSLTQYNLACCLALAGQTKEALGALSSAIELGYDDALDLERDPDLAPLHNDKGWQSVLDACRKKEQVRANRMADPLSVRINTDNLRRFWHAYDEATRVGPRESAGAYDRLYFRNADGPLTFMLQTAQMTPTKFAKLAESHGLYLAFLKTRQQDLATQTRVLRDEFVRFKRLYPAARFPDVYLMIGGFNSAGRSSNDGLLVGAEFFGKYPDAPNAGLSDWEKRILAPPVDFVPLAVHECIHFQQGPLTSRTLLAQTLHEGAADFVAYLVTGRMMERTRDLHLWANPRERDIWLQFKKEMDGQSINGWLYANPKPGWPEDTAYWLGFKICESYYGRATDKAQALKEVLTITDPRAFLDKSGYADKFGSG